MARKTSTIMKIKVGRKVFLKCKFCLKEKNRYDTKD